VLNSAHNDRGAVSQPVNGKQLGVVAAESHMHNVSELLPITVIPSQLSSVSPLHSETSEHFPNPATAQL
jgi:hypothetical protein